MAKDFAAQYEPIIQGAAKAFDLDPNILRGMAQTESGFDPDVISGKRPSKAGAIGIMQFMPETAKRFGVDPTNPKQAIFASAQYLRENLDKFGGDYQKAVAGYNWGENRDAYNQQDWVKRLPAETKGYVKQVLTHAAQRAGSEEEKPATKPAATTDAIPAAREETTYEKVRKYAAPIVEGAGAVLGGLAGTAAGPAGTVLGAGLGYGISKELVEAADVYLGGKQRREGMAQVTEPVKNVLEGATMETGGRVAAPIIGAAVKGGANVVGKVMDLPKQSVQKAARIARESVGDMDVVVNALRTARPGATPAQALAEAGINEPVAQALLSRSALRKEGAKFFSDVTAAENADAINALSQIAGGTTQTGAKAGQAAAKKEVNALLEPIKDQILARANVGGTTGMALREQAAEQGAKAAAAVEDVRRFTAAGERAPSVFEGISAQRYPGEPKAPLRYTYGGDLAKRADEVATQAAKGSLEFGESARFAQAAADQLEAAGLKPLETGPILQGLQRVASDPKLAGSEALKYLPRVADDIQKWTKNGVIDANALDSIRKNSVNAVINDMTNLDTKAKKALAAKVMTELKPLLIDAMEAAGGKGYRDYLTSYANEMQKIGQMKLGAKALDLFEKSPKRFVALVEGNSPKDVEKIFGPGSYDIVTEMSQDAMKKLQATGQIVKGRAAAAEQSEKGITAFQQVLEENTSKFRLPNFLSPKITATNTVLDVLEKKVGKETVRTLTEAAKTTKDFDALLNTLPAIERNKVLKVLNNPSEWKIGKALNKPGVAAGVVNALRGPIETENALVQ